MMEAREVKGKEEKGSLRKKDSESVFLLDPANRYQSIASPQLGPNEQRSLLGIDGKCEESLGLQM